MADKAFVVKNGLTVNGSLIVADPSSNRIGILTATPAVTFDLRVATDALHLPVGNSSQRSAGANGQLRYSNTTNNFEGFANGAWGPIQGPSLGAPGSNTQVVYNDSSVEGASAGFLFNKATNAVSIANSLSVGTATVNSTNFGIAGLAGNSTAIQINGGSVLSNTQLTIGNTQVISGTITLGAGATINTTSYTGAAATAGSATSATNASQLNSQSASFYLDCGNFTGTLGSARLGTTGTPQFGALGVGVAAPATNNLQVYGTISSLTAITSTGDITSNSSDRRLKHLCEPIQDALDKVLRLNGFTYEYNDLAHALGHKGYKRQVGLFADEVEAVQPEITPLSPIDVDIFGNSISGENYKTVMYERLVPLLVEAIKELAYKVQKLEEERL